MQMAESQPVPTDSLNSILVYLDIERRSYEDHKDDRQFDHVFRHATKVREWLSSLAMSKPGLVVVIREPDDTEIDPSGHSWAVVYSASAIGRWACLVLVT